jgi:16S rRNA (cytidine1402-2'-O)-methyltransferase
MTAEPHSSENRPGTLFLVATPIGNLQDMTERAIETLKTVDLIACEDTRHTRKLLNHCGIKSKLVSYHAHNEAERAAELGSMLSNGVSVAIVSDAGTPGISDPGHAIVRKAIEIGADVIPVPGPVAFVAAVIASGLRTDSFLFGGFLPSKKGERRKRLADVSSVGATLVFHEAPHRLRSALADCLEILGDRKAAVGREITKLHEEFIRGKLSELVDRFSYANPRGELVLVIDRARKSDISGRGESTVSLEARVKELESEGMEQKAALKKAAKEFGLSRSEAYRKLHHS